MCITHYALKQKTMILPISIIGTSVLRKKAETVTKDYPDLQKLIDDMFETMYKTEGVGLAAPQVGHSIRLFVCDAAPMTDDDNDTFTKSFKRAMLNPEIIETFGANVSYNEGCLSIPGLHENVVRPDGVKIRYYDENFELHEETLTGNCAASCSTSTITWTAYCSPTRWVCSAANSSATSSPTSPKASLNTIIR